MAMSVPFTSFEGSYQFQAIHGHILILVHKITITGRRTDPYFFIQWKFPPKFPDFFVNGKQSSAPSASEWKGKKKPFRSQKSIASD